MRKILLIVSLLCLFTSTAHAGRDKLSDQEKLDKGWIVSYVDYENNDTVAVLDVQAVVKSPPEKVWRLLSDVSRWKKWMPILSRCIVLNESVAAKIIADPKKSPENYALASASPSREIAIADGGVTNAKTFEEFDLPWPVNNDWDVRDYKFNSQYAVDSKYEVTWNRVVNNTDRLGGTWKLSKYNDKPDETLFDYHYRIKVKDGVPKKVFEIVIGKTIDRFITAIRKNT